MVEGPGDVFICTQCVDLCRNIFQQEKQRSSRSDNAPSSLPSPKEIVEHLDRYVIGQDQAKRFLAVAVHAHYLRIGGGPERPELDESDAPELEKSNVLMVGPTGTGKTLLAKSLARMLDVPFAIGDATTLTEAGYVGEDVENIVLNLYQASGNNLERTVKGIVYVDEIDKLAKKSFTSSVSRDVSGEGVQQALLKIIEGTQANIQVRGNKRLPNQEYLQVDTSNILFICGGSFEGMRKIIEQRLGRKTVGFLNAKADDADAARAPVEDKQVLSQVTPEDLEKFGLIPEFIGRLPVIAVMDDLDEEDLVRILQEPKNSLVRQYEKLFKFEKVALEFTDEALRAIARKAVERKTGARGLRTILENVMLEIMYEIPSQDNIREVLIDEEVITEGKAPDTSPVRDYGVSG